MIATTKKDGRKDFLGRCMCKPVVRTEDSTQPKLEWIQLKRDNNENAGELLACFELFMLDDNNASKLLPPFPTKIGALYKVPDGIRPVLQRNIIEVSCKHNDRFLLSRKERKNNLQQKQHKLDIGMGSAKHEDVPAVGRRSTPGDIRVRRPQDRNGSHQERQEESQL